MTARVPVTFEPSGFIAWVEPGTTVLAAGRAAGVNISAPCGGRGICGECGVKVLEGSLGEPSADERVALKRAPAGIRLACRALVSGPVRLRPVIVNSTVSREIADLAGNEELVTGVDLGTTSVSATVLDSRTGRQLGSATVMNRQSSFGADVLSRVSGALEGDAAQLQHLAEGSVLDAIDSAAPGARSRMTRVVVAANVAMASLLAGADVSSLAAHPFSVPTGASTLPPDSGLADSLQPASVEIVPAAAGFVGGDVIAGLVALGVVDSHGGVLLVDIGTNAEVALIRRGHLWVASAAAGPAFEGGGISCGGPAAPEAVVSVTVGDDGAVSLRTLGDAQPTWFSGAGLVSAIAELRRVGHIDAEGRMDQNGPLRARFDVDNQGVLGVALGAGGDCLSVTQLDVRAFQLAKAAVRVAITSVLERAGVKASKLESTYISGAFGTALSTADLSALGVIPRQTAGMVVHAGNTSLRGAAAIAVDPSMMDAARELSARVELVDLAADAEFPQRLMLALQLDSYSA